MFEVAELIVAGEGGREDDRVTGSALLEAPCQHVD